MKRRAYDNWPVANMWLRLAAQIVDQTIVLIGTAMVLSFTYPQRVATAQWWLLLFFIWPLVSMFAHCLFLYYTATSPGKKAFGLKVVSAKSGSRLSAWQVLSRQTMWWLGALSFGVGWTTILTRADRRALHDIVSETYVANQSKNKVTGTVSLWQKTLGHSWAVTVSLLFFSFVSAFVIYEFQRFNEKQIEASQFGAETGSEDKMPLLEEASWLVFTDQYDQTPVHYLNLDEEKLGQQIKYFLQARKLPNKEKFDFYKNKMQSNEDTLCAKINGAECSSAQLLASLLSGVESKTAKLDNAFTALRVLYNVEHSRFFEEKTRILQAELSQVSPDSISYMALKTYLIKLHSQRGDFARAAQYIGAGVLPEDPSPVATLLTEKYYEYSCQAQGFYKCDTSNLKFCSENKFWKQWNHGCTEVEMGTEDSNSTKLGFVWNKLLKSKLSDTDWNANRGGFKNMDSQEQSVFSALDFVMNLKSSEPANLVEKSKQVTLENPLWGWAQTQAIREFGDQWVALINGQGQNQAEHYALLKSVSPRFIASIKKSASKKSRKRNRHTN